jgi:hypothetical protein
MDRLSLLAYLGLFIALMGVLSLIESYAVAFENSFIGNFYVDYSAVELGSGALIFIGVVMFLISKSKSEKKE